MRGKMATRTEGPIDGPATHVCEKSQKGFSSSTPVAPTTSRNDFQQLPGADDAAGREGVVCDHAGECEKAEGSEPDWPKEEAEIEDCRVSCEGGGLGGKVEIGKAES
jgi:hypothetical protein